jgi:hypothetical protein
MMAAGRKISLGIKFHSMSPMTGLQLNLYCQLSRVGQRYSCPNRRIASADAAFLNVFAAKKWQERKISCRLSYLQQITDVGLWSGPNILPSASAIAF